MRTIRHASHLTPVAVAAAPGTAFSLQMKGLVDAVAVVVAEHVMRARHHATGATSAQPRGHDLVVKVGPVGHPAFPLRRHAHEGSARRLP